MKHALLRFAAFLVLAALAPCPLVAAQEKDKGSVIDEILDIMRRGGQITEEQQNELQKRAKEEEQQKQTLAGIDDDTLRPFLRSPGGDFRLEFGGFVQFDFDAAQNDTRLLTGANLFNTFLVRRARLNMSGQLFNWIFFKIEGDYGTQQNPAFALTDGYLDSWEMRYRVRPGLSRNTLTTSAISGEITAWGWTSRTGCCVFLTSVQVSRASSFRYSKPFFAASTRSRAVTAAEGRALP